MIQSLTKAGLLKDNSIGALIKSLSACLSKDQKVEPTALELVLNTLTVLPGLGKEGKTD